MKSELWPGVPQRTPQEDPSVNEARRSRGEGTAGQRGLWHRHVPRPAFVPSGQLLADSAGRGHQSLLVPGASARDRVQPPPSWQDYFLSH